MTELAGEGGQPRYQEIPATRIPIAPSARRACRDRDAHADHEVLAYVFEGAVEIAGEIVREGEMANLGEGDVVHLRGAETSGRLLLLAGVPLREPRMGEITRTARTA